LLELLSRVNWVDVLVVILLIRITYTSSHIGVGKQILPLLLLVLILLLTLYNYKDIASFFTNRYSFTPSVCEFLTFTLMAFVFFLIYHFVSRVTGLALFSGEAGAAPGMEKIGGAVLGTLRSFIIIGMVLMGLLMAPVKFTEDGVRNSYSGFFFIEMDLKFYNFATGLIFKGDEEARRRTLAGLVPADKAYLFKTFDIKKKSRFLKNKK